MSQGPTHLLQGSSQVFCSQCKSPVLELLALRPAPVLSSCCLSHLAVPASAKHGPFILNSMHSSNKGSAPHPWAPGEHISEQPRPAGSMADLGEAVQAGVRGTHCMASLITSARNLCADTETSRVLSPTAAATTTEGEQCAAQHQEHADTAICAWQPSVG